MSIILNHIDKKYGQQLAVQNISFEIKKGEIVGFIGPNGAGKSTTMKIITGYIPPSAGEIKVNGLDAVEHSLEIRRVIGYLPESNPLYGEMYVKEYLRYIAGIRGLSKQADERVDEIIKRTGLIPEVHKKIQALSKGFKQRVGLAQALIHDPEILILDEPTSGLDPNQIIEIRNLISELGKEKTIMMSTHILQEVVAICSRVIVINNGRIVGDESMARISTEELESKFRNLTMPVSN